MEQTVHSSLKHFFFHYLSDSSAFFETSVESLRSHHSERLCARIINEFLLQFLTTWWSSARILQPTEIQSDFWHFKITFSHPNMFWNVMTSRCCLLLCKCVTSRPGFIFHCCGQMFKGHTREIMGVCLICTKNNCRIFDFKHEKLNHAESKVRLQQIKICAHFPYQYLLSSMVYQMNSPICILRAAYYTFSCLLCSPPPMSFPTSLHFSAHTIDNWQETCTCRGSTPFTSWMQPDEEKIK